MLSHPDLNKDNIGTPGISDRQLVEQILKGNTFLAAQFLKKDCYPVFQYIKNTRLRTLDLSIDDMINDFYIYLQENSWEKLRTFRFESKLQTWINLVASRYLLKKYWREVKENGGIRTPIDNIRSFTDEGQNSTFVRADLLEAISRIKDKKARQVLMMTLQGFESSEIAEQLGISVNNVYIIKSRAIKKLKDLLK